MDRYVSVDLLVKKMRSLYGLTENEREEYILAKAIETVQEAPVADAKARKGWILTECRTPEQQVNVLAYKKWQGKISHKVIFDTIIAHVNSEGVWRDYYGKDVNGSIVAWTPLPKEPAIVIERR